ERSLAGRALAVRTWLDPDRLAAEAAETAQRILGGGKGAGTRPGPEWVIPPLRWLHEIDRVYPMDSDPPDVFGPAPRPDFARPGAAAGLRAAGRAGRARPPERAAGERSAPQPVLDGAGAQPDARLDGPSRR